MKNLQKINESLPLKSNDMKITEFWKKKVLEILNNLYGEGLRYDKADEFLNNVIKKCAKPVAHFRNIYKAEEFEYPLDDILKLINSNGLICGANGSFTYNQKIKLSEGTELLEKWLNERDILKKKAIKCDEMKDLPGLRKYDNLQNSKKENNNSFYGVSTMNGYILYNPDTASMITLQARELISEIMWVLEKFLSSNLCFINMNEFYSFINESLNDNIDISMIEQYSIKIPNFEMLKERLKEYLSYIPEEEKKNIDNNKTLFLMLKNIEKNPIKSVNFYYKYNLYNFLIHNPKVMNIMNWIMEQRKEFNSPYLSIMEKSESKIYIEPINELIKILMNFVVLPIPTYDRVNKYIEKGRKSVLISDTDSVIIRLDDWIEFINSNSTVKFDTFYDNNDIHRAANTMAFICTEICNFMCRNMTKYCYVPEEYRERIRLKNEFFFKSLIIYSSIKKNYSAWTILREGVKVNKLSNTGLALTGSNINPYVKKCLDDLILNEIHKVKDVSITRIMKRIYDLENDIRNKILKDRDLSFTKYTSYKSNNNAKPYSDSRIRGVLIWNHLYPDNKIEFYNKIYILNTILEKEDQLYLIKDPEMREYLRDKIFNNPVNILAKPFGLRTLALPDSIKQYPEWLVDIVDINKLVEHHINSFTSLLPSIGVYINRISSTRNHMSSMINLK